MITFVPGQLTAHLCSNQKHLFLESASSLVHVGPQKGCDSKKVVTDRHVLLNALLDV